MTNRLFGFELSVEVPAKVLELVGDIKRPDGVDEVFKLLLGEFYDQFDPRFMIISYIIFGMVENDATFEQSKIFSRDAFEERITSIKDIVGKLEDDVDLKSRLSMIMGQLLKDAKALQYQSGEKRENVSVKLPKMSRGFYYTLSKLDLINSAEKLSADEKISCILRSRFINPIKQMVLKMIGSLDSDLSEDILDEDDVHEFEGLFDSYYLGVILGRILSVVLTEAINDGISFSEAVGKLGIDAIEKQVYEKLMAVDDLSEKADAMNKMCDSILPLLDI